MTDHTPPLAGAAGEDVSGGTSVSGVGGEELRTDAEQVGLPPVGDPEAAAGWRRTAAASPEQPVASNDGTGQSEKPSPGT